MILPGRMVLVELKRPRGSRLSWHQKEYMKLFSALNVECCIVKSAADIARLLA